MPHPPPRPAHARHEASAPAGPHPIVHDSPRRALAPRPGHREAGVTLVEMMVAVTVSLVLLAGIAQIFATNSDTARFSRSLARLQESGRFALDEMATEIRMAGFLGCRAAGTTINLGLTGTGAGFDPLVGLQGWEAADTAYGEAPGLNADGATVEVDDGDWATSAGAAPLENFAALPGSDIVRTWRAEAEATGVEAVGASAVDVALSSSLAEGDLVTLADCQRVDVLRVCAAEVGTTQVELDFADGDGCPSDGVRNATPVTVTSTVGGTARRLTGSVYYIGKRDDDASAPPALFRRRLRGDGTPGPAEELVQDVENLQLVYGVDNDGDRELDEYLAADEVADWTTVLAVRVELLLTSSERGLADAGQSIRFNGTDDVQPGDTRLRQSMSSTVTLRNRTF